MKNKMIIILSVTLAFTCPANADFAKTCKNAVKTIPDNSITYKGKNEWLFTGAELRHLSVGTFWGENAAKVSRCRRPDRADPGPAIINFNNQLKKLGIKLIMVPVPPKATVYPEGIAKGIKPEQTNKALNSFYKYLHSKGVDVLNLSETFIKAKNNTRTVYCRQDSHWSGYGCEIAANEIANKIKSMPWYKEAKKNKYFATMKEIQIEGDLWKSLKDKSLPKEKLILKFISNKTIDTQSPVLLMGDSHTLIFHTGGDMLAKKAGLADQLAFTLGTPVDLLAVRGSGATSVRISLYRKAKRGNWIAGKKVVIWCFTAREFTESLSGWRKIPVVK